MNASGKKEKNLFARIEMSRNTRLVIGFLLLLALLVGVVVATISWPTNAPSKYALDYLKINNSILDIERRVEIKKMGTMIGKDVSGFAFKGLTQEEIKQIQDKSGGLVRRVDLRADGVIAVVAAMSPRRSFNETKTIEVHLLFVPKYVENGKFEWACFGTPIDALPRFCKGLEKIPQ